MSEHDERRKSLLRQSQNYKETKDILHTMFEKIRSTRDDKYAYSRYANFMKDCMTFHEKWKDVQEISEVLRGLKTDVQYNNSKLQSMSKMLAYLGLVESIGRTLMDIVVIMHVATGKDVHTKKPYLRHIESFEELKNVDLWYKLEFLKREGLSIFGKSINRDVRNTIAHLKFKIEKNGEIRKLDGSPINIDKVISEFWEGVDTLMLVLKDIDFIQLLEALQDKKKEDVHYHKRLKEKEKGVQL